MPNNGDGVWTVPANDLGNYRQYVEVNHDGTRLNARQADRLHRLATEENLAFESVLGDNNPEAREKRIKERAFWYFLYGNPEDMEAYLSIEGNYSKAKIRELTEEFTKRELTLGQKVQLFLQGKVVDGMNQEIVDAYFLEEKKKRFLKRDERDRLHKPVTDGDKATSSVKVDDLVPPIADDVVLDTEEDLIPF